MNLKELMTKYGADFAGLATPDAVLAKVDEVVAREKLTFILDNEPFVPKARLDEVIGQKNEFKAQTTALSGELDALKKQAASLPELQKQIEALQGKEQEFVAKHAATLINSHIKLAAVQAGANDPGDLLPFIDTSKLTLKEDDSVDGLSEQLKTLKEKKPYLFKNDTPVITGVKTGSGAIDPNKKRYTKAELEAMTPDEVNKIPKDVLAASLKTL